MRSFRPLSFSTPKHNSSKPVKFSTPAGKHSKSITVKLKTTKPGLELASKTSASESTIPGRRGISSLLKPQTLARQLRLKDEEKPSFNYYVTIAHKADTLPKKSSEDYYQEHLKSTLHALSIIKRMPALTLPQINNKKVRLNRAEGKKTLIFDLDETLVHCCEPGQKADVYLPIKLPSGNNVLTGINVRPYALDVLLHAKALFEVVIFTASHQNYADTVLNHIDPRKQLIDHRFYREHCITVNGRHVKDLRIFENRKLADIVIVDNSVFSFAYQLENGVPIVSWFDDKHDRELFNLIDYLKILAEAEDVRRVNKKTFRLRNFFTSHN